MTTAKPKKGPARFKKAQSVEPNSRDLVDQLIASTTNIDSVIRPVDGFAVAAPNCPVESPVEVETATASPTSSEPSTSLLDEMVELYGSEAEVIQSGAHPELNTHGQPWTGNIFEDH